MTTQSYQGVKQVEARKRDVVIRIADWTRDKDEPAYDVELYIHGVYNGAESKTFCTRNAGRTRKHAKTLAISFAQQQLAKFV